MKTSGTSLLLALVLALALPACLAAVAGNGEMSSEIRDPGEFTRLKVSGPFTVYLSPAEKTGMKIETDKNLLSKVVVENDGGVLHLDTKGSLNPTASIYVYLDYTQLRGLDISGAVKINSEGPLTGDELSLDVSGASQVKLELNVERLNADLSGATGMELTGKVNQMYIDGSGALKVNAYELQAQRAKIDLSGAGSVKINVKEQLDASLSGASALYYKGKPEVTQDVSGAAVIKSKGP